MNTPDDFAEFYRESWKHCVRSVAPVVGSFAVAEELVQDAFVKAAQRWEQLRWETHRRAWVTRVAINAGLSHRRRRAAEHRAFERIGGVPKDVAPVVAAHEDLYGLIETLPRRQEAAVRLVYLAGMDSAQAAEVVGCAPSTLRTHLERGLNRLREQYQLEVSK